MSILFKSVLIVGVSTTLMSCASKNQPCEDILEVKRQALQCVRWHKIMYNNHYPQQASTAKNRYEQECQNLRFYRDNYDTICKGNETVIGGIKTSHRPNN
jgi:hypothetical protein